MKITMKNEKWCS